MSVSSLAFISSSGSVSQVRSSSKGDSIVAGRPRRRHKVIPSEYHYRPLPDPKQPCGSGIAGDKLLQLQSAVAPPAASVAVTTLPMLRSPVGASRAFERPLSPTSTRQQAELERRIALMRAAMEEATADPFGSDARALLALPGTIVNEDFTERYGAGPLPISTTGSFSSGASFAHISFCQGQFGSSEVSEGGSALGTHRSDALLSPHSVGARENQNIGARRTKQPPFLRITDTSLPSNEEVSYSLQHKLDTLEARRALSELLSEEESDRAWNTSRCWEEQRVIVLAKEEFDRSVRLYLKALERRETNLNAITVGQPQLAATSAAALMDPQRDGSSLQPPPPSHRRDTQVPQHGPLVVDEVPKMMRAVQTLIIQQSLNLSMS